MNLPQVLAILRKLAPEETALPDDPVGLLIGQEDPVDVHRIGVCLDADPAAVAGAIAQKVQILITHHPLIYQPLKRILPVSDMVSRSVTQLIKSDIALYAMHTNWDLAPGGINDTLAAALGLQTIRPLGNEGASRLPRLGTLPEPMPSSEFAGHIKKALVCAGASALRNNQGIQDALISKVAVCGGAGAVMLSEAIAAGADAYVTSDVRHHEFVDAMARDFPLYDAGHGATERPGMRALAALLTEMLPTDITVVFLDDFPRAQTAESEA